MGRPALTTIEVATPTRLLDAAEAEFGRAGYAGTKLAAIARRAGIRRPSLLYHFGSKQLLYGAVVERVFEDLGEALSNVMESDAGFSERVRGLIETFSRFLERRPHLALVLLREMLDARGPGRDILMRRVVPLLGVVEAFIRTQGRGLIRPGLPVRAALMQVVANLLLHAAAGELRRPLWGAGDHGWALAHGLLFEEGK